jgi:phenylpropionate dioxygenase-like ring-hydroxylating dioxygenase large terminal subunit
LVDNLLDLSHETYLHNGSIGTPEVATTPIEVEATRTNAGGARLSPHERRRVPAVLLAHDRTHGQGRSVAGHRLLPSGLLPTARAIAPVSQPPLPDGSDEHAFHMKIFYGLTPSTETSVYDFWALSRDFCVGDDEIDRLLWKRCSRTVVQEDVDALNILQRRSEGLRRGERGEHQDRPRRPRSAKDAGRDEGVRGELRIVVG